MGSKAVAKRARRWASRSRAARRHISRPASPARSARSRSTARPDVRVGTWAMVASTCPAADDPRGQSRRLDCLEGAEARSREGRVGPDRVPDQRHPPGTATPRSTRRGDPCSRQKARVARRPIAAKTGTAQDARDLATYGYLAPPKDKDKPGLVVGIWMGNSDHSLPRTATRRLANLGSASVARLRRGVHEEVADRQVPAPEQGRDGNDRRSGGKPGRWTRETRKEFFVRGTQPTARNAVDKAGLLYSVFVAAGVSTPSRRSSVRQPGTATSRSGCAALAVASGSSADGTRRRRTCRARPHGAVHSSDSASVRSP